MLAETADAPTLCAMSEYASWEFEEGEEIAPGRVVLKTIGGGNRYEVCLVWDESLFALAVAKVLRPDQARRRRRCATSARGRGARARWRTRSLVRSFDAVLDGPHPHVLIEHLEGPSLRRLIKRDGAIALAAAAAARRPRRRRPAVHGPERLRPPRRQARQHHHGGAAAADRPQHRPHPRARREDRAGRSAPTPTCRRSSACGEARGRRSARPPTPGGWERRSSTPSPGEKPFPTGSGDEGAERFPQLERGRRASCRRRCRRRAARAAARAARPRSRAPPELRRGGRAARAAGRRAAAQDEA